MLFVAYPNVFDNGNGCPAAPNPTESVTWHLSTSSDGGLTWGSAPIATDANWPFCVGKGDSNNQNRNHPQFAFNSRTGACFVALNMSTGAPGTPEDLGTRTKVFRSTDGTTWNPVFSGTTRASGKHDQWAPALGLVNVTGISNARLGVTWHDTRDDTTSPTQNELVSVYGAVSLDDGVTWNFANVGRISNCPTGGCSPGQQIPWPVTDTWGDYEGLVGQPKTSDFRAAWADNRSGGASQVWTATLTGN